jgi:hypothetical protein
MLSPRDIVRASQLTVRHRSQKPLALKRSRGGTSPRSTTSSVRASTRKRLPSSVGVRRQRLEPRTRGLRAGRLPAQSAPPAQTAQLNARKALDAPTRCPDSCHEPFQAQPVRTAPEATVSERWRSREHHRRGGAVGHRDRRPGVCHRRPDRDQGDRWHRRCRLRAALEVLPVTAAATSGRRGRSSRDQGR